MTYGTLALVAAAALLAGCAPMSRDSEGRAAAIAAAQPVGDPISCVATPAIADTRVLDDQTIEFRMRNGDIYLNRLPEPLLGPRLQRGLFVPQLGLPALLGRPDHRARPRQRDPGPDLRTRAAFRRSRRAFARNAGRRLRDGPNPC